MRQTLARSGLVNVTQHGVTLPTGTVMGEAAETNIGQLQDQLGRDLKEQPRRREAGVLVGAPRRTPDDG